MCKIVYSGVMRGQVALEVDVIVKVTRGADSLSLR